MHDKSDLARALAAAPHRLVQKAQNRAALDAALKQEIKKLTALAADKPNAPA